MELDNETITSQANEINALKNRVNLAERLLQKWPMQGDFRSPHWLGDETRKFLEGGL